MTDLRKAAEMAIDAMMTGDVHKRAVAIIELRQALAQPEQEPVACEHEWVRTAGMLSGDWRCFNCGEWEYNAGLVDAVNISQERVDETAKYRHEPYDQTALELCDKCGWKAIIPDEGCLVCARNEQEPVAWADKVGAVIPHSHKLFQPDLLKDYTRPLYTAPPKREWVGLTDEEKDWCINGTAWVGEEKEVRVKIVEAVLAKAKERNT